MVYGSISGNTINLTPENGKSIKHLQLMRYNRILVKDNVKVGTNTKLEFEIERVAPFGNSQVTVAYIRSDDDFSIDAKVEIQVSYTDHLATKCNKWHFTACKKENEDLVFSSPIVIESNEISKNPSEGDIGGIGLYLDKLSGKSIKIRMKANDDKDYMDDYFMRAKITIEGVAGSISISED